MSIPAEGIRAITPDRGEPPFLVPQASLLTTRVAFTSDDLEAARRSMACHKTQFAPGTVDRVFSAMRDVWKGKLPLSPMVPQPASNDLFR